MKQKGGAAYKEMLGRMAFAFCTYAMDLSIPGWIQIFLSSNSEICYKNTKMWLIYFSFFFYLLIWMQVSCHGDLHSLALVKVRIQSLCVHSKPFQVCSLPDVMPFLKDTLLRIDPLWTPAFCLPSTKDWEATFSSQIPNKCFQKSLNLELSRNKKTIRWFPRITSCSSA